MTTAAEERAARRESIPVESVIVEPEKLAEVEAEAVAAEEPVNALATEELPVDEPTEETVVEEPVVKEKTISQKTFDNRIAKEVEKTRKEREAREAAEARLAALERKEGKTELTPDEIREQVRLEEKQRIETEIFNNACNNLVKEAEKDIPNFQQRYKEFTENVDVLPRPVIDSLLNLENGHNVLNHLLDNPDIAINLMSLSERRQTIELAKLSDKLVAPPKPKVLSKATPPIKPLGGAVRATVTLSDNDSDSDWIAKRKASMRPRDYSNR